MGDMMKKVITYGTYDLLHFGHIRLLKRAKALGDYLIVGVTSDDYDKARGKINNQQSLMERITAVKETGIADEVIVEEYEGQKIDDIRRYGVEIFAIGADWEGKFDYLREYCQVKYLPRTDGISSTEIRKLKNSIFVKVIGEANIGTKFIKESSFVNGVEVVNSGETAVYLVSAPELHYEQIIDALERGKHVLCESPICISEKQFEHVQQLSKKKNLLLMEGIKTAYSTAYARLVLLAKGGKIGDILSVDAVCTSMKYLKNENENQWGSLCAWGPTALLPVFQILGTSYLSKKIVTKKNDKFDGFTKIDFLYPHATASIKVAKAAKSEGELIITGTKGYIYVPAPWWKTDYFEVRYENAEENKRYFYQLDGEGLRYEIVAFNRAIRNNKSDFYVSKNVSRAICKIMEDYYNQIDVFDI